MCKISKEYVSELLNAVEGKKIAVIGDVMLDRYFWGNVSRISPEAPVPVIDIESESFHLGGAANVANNLKSLGVEPILCGIIGSDNTGKNFIDISNSLGINPDFLIIDSTRPTTVKTRIIGNNQHIARLDREIKEEISSEIEELLINTLLKCKDLSGIIFEDYNKGCITKNIIERIISYSKENNIPIFVDPKFYNFLLYSSVKLFKPNKKEASTALNKQIKSVDDIISSGKELISKLNCENVLITLGADGMMLFESNGEISSIPTRARKVADVSGAGDTVIATLASINVAGASIKDSCIISNYASGIVCEEPGIVSITKNSLINSF